MRTGSGSGSGAAAGVACPVCGKVVRSEFALRGHMTTHKANHKAESPTVSAAAASDGRYDDWAGVVGRLIEFYKIGVNVLIIGPKGVGKTEAVREAARRLGKTMYEVNFSLRTRESHLVGALTLENGSVRFAEGIIVRAMREGALLYLDELNAAEPDVLVRLNEALDDRRQLVLKEYNGEVVRAAPGFWVVATVNPLSHYGTKELPPQILSRFPVRIYMDYPPADVELRIVERHVGPLRGEQAAVVKRFVELAGDLRAAAARGDLPYSPSLRESIAFARLLKAGFDVREAVRYVLVDVYAQYTPDVYESVKQIVGGKF